MIKLHHGPPGSYKTSGAIRDDLVRAVWEGRHVVTNVRGLSNRDLIAETVKNNPPVSLLKRLIYKAKRLAGISVNYGQVNDFELTYVDCDLEEGREKMARFWHWAPENAFLQIDEVQRIWPKRETETQLKRLDLPEEKGVRFSNGKPRPVTYMAAFDMHRHGGWDMVFTTPDISKVRPEIRGAAETAYLHVNLNDRGLKGFYIEAKHDANDNGTSNRQFWSQRTRRMPKWVFELYESTATGTHRDTFSGASVFGSPKVIGAFGLIAICVWWVLSRGPFDRGSGSNLGAMVAAYGSAGDRVADQKNDSSAVGSQARSAGGRDGDRKQVRPFISEPLSGWSVSLSGKTNVVIAKGSHTRFVVRRDYLVTQGQMKMLFTDEDMKALGYQIDQVSECVVKLTVEEVSRFAFGCGVEEEPKPQPLQAALGGAKDATEQTF